MGYLDKFPLLSPDRRDQKHLIFVISFSNEGNQATVRRPRGTLIHRGI